MSLYYYRISLAIAVDGFYCPLYFSCGLGTAKGYITIKYIKKWAVLGLARDCIHGPHVVHSCGRLIHNGKLWWDTYYQPSYCLQEVMSAVGSVCIADGNINTSYIQYILRYKRRHKVYQALWLTKITRLSEQSLSFKLSRPLVVKSDE